MISTDKEEQYVILGALLMLKLFGNARPDRAKVIQFISVRRLMRFYPEDFKIRSTGDEAWANDLSWAREDLKKQGLLEMPSPGTWKLSDKGKEEIESTAKAFLVHFEKTKKPISSELDGFRRISEEFIGYLLRIARGEKWWVEVKSNNEAQ